MSLWRPRGRPRARFGLLSACRGASWLEEMEEWKVVVTKRLAQLEAKGSGLGGKEEQEEKTESEEEQTLSE